MVGSEVTHRIGCGGVAGKREGLAAAAAEIQLATRAACAWLLHPCGATEGVEGRRVRPDIGERMVSHVPELKSGNRLGGVAGQHLACRRHVERAPAPTADAWLWIAGIVVRNHRIDHDAAVVTSACLQRLWPIFSSRGTGLKSTKAANDEEWPDLRHRQAA